MSERLWDRTRRRVQEEVVDAALALFLEQGFEETTVDQVVAATGISRRSFFRYFGSKEDIVFGDLAEQGPVILAALRARPDDEPIWEALAHAFEVIGEHTSFERGAAIGRLVATTPALRAAHLEKHLRWQEALAPEVERRVGTGGAPAGLVGEAIVATLLACLDAASTVWLRQGGGDLGELRRLTWQALDAVRSGR
ncbi:TetR/AcrR family transcriptional regulator [Lentzea chajnantorensis]